MNTMSHEKTIAYRSGVFPLNRPDRIGAMAALHGLNVNNFENCRVLELGCGDGITLLSIAHSMPSSECFGIDLLTERIAEAKQFGDEIGLSNATFLAKDVMDLDPRDLGEFDFIIAHGLYSWVPEKAREKILDIYRNCLVPKGAGLISFNVYPGWHFRDLVRDAMLFAADGITEPGPRADAAITFTRELAWSTEPSSLYQAVLTREVESAALKDRSILLYDELADNNQPLRFQTFIEQLETAGLKYVAEIEPRNSQIGGLSPWAGKILDELAGSPLRRESFLDLLFCTRFRNSIVCRTENETSYDPTAKWLESLFLTTNAHHSPDASLSDHSEVAFTRQDKPAFSTNHFFTKTMLGILTRSRPVRVSFAEICTTLKSEFSDLAESDLDREIAQLKRFTIELIGSAIVEAGCYRPPIKASVEVRPEVSAFARGQADGGSQYVTNLYGVSYQLENDLLRALIVALDGSKSVEEAPASILELVQVPAEDHEQIIAVLPGFVDQGLEQLRRMALLVE